MIGFSLPVTELSLTALLEALLFVAPMPVTPAQLAVALERPLNDIENGLKELEDRYASSQQSEHGLRLQRHRGRVQLTTAPQAAPFIERMLGLEASSRLSRAALETLAIVMYRQPATRPQIDSIRGVNSDGVLKSLLSKGLIQEIGRNESPGRPILYGTTAEFLQYFGLFSLADLPPLELEDLLSGVGSGSNL
ncbi:MAG: SMC-Scp complex subunit ScpB [Chloroflexi bacterium RBG_16_54_18]|nr:MAG: SMC-Scp complex subunit ScpB [Chloroflexi bacterium RBG_16_54_18]